MNAASAGKWAAIALFCFTGILVLIAAVAGLSRSGRVEPGADGFAWESGIPEARWVDPGTLGDETGVLAAGEDWTWRQVNESGVVEYEITAARVDPEEGGRILLTEPRAIMYLGERIARVSAAEGELVKPGEREPESGRLGGGVLVELFEVGSEAGGGDVLDGRDPIGTMRTRSLAFETALGQVETPDEIVVESEGLRFVGRGLTARIGELERGRHYRLNLLRIEESGGVRLMPRAFAREGDGTPGTGPRAGDSPGEASEGAEGPEDFYRAVFSDNVMVTRGAWLIGAERLSVFARLIGGKLSADAIRWPEIPRESGEEVGSGDGRGVWTRSFEGDPGAPRSPGASGEEIVLTWSGSLEIRPERLRPGELARDDVLVRFASPLRNVVDLVDGVSGASARCATLMYGLSSARMIMSGVGPSLESVRLTAPGVGEVLGNDLVLELADLPRGRVTMDSGGAAMGDAGGEIRWGGRAEIGFEVARAGGRLTVLPLTASCGGGVSAREGGQRISAQFARAEFRERRRLDGTPEARLVRLFAHGGVDAETRDGGKLHAREAEVRFDGRGAKPTPVSASAHGSVRVERDGDWLSSEHLDARFATDSSGRPIVSDIDADTGVALGTPDGFGARTEQLRADLVQETYELSGDASELSYEHAGGRYALRGASMRIDGRSRRLDTTGAGEATFRLTGADGAQDSGRLEWADGMSYDDMAGVAEMLGEVVASRIPGPMERQHAEAERARVLLTPWTAGSGDPEERALRAIELNGGDGIPALMELRRYREGAPEGVELETLAALRSSVIQYDAPGELLRVPRAGLLLIEDRRSGEEAPGSSAIVMGGDADSRGTTAFEWGEGLRFERRTGVAVMKRGVRVRHVGLETGRLTQLDCETLIANFRRPDEDAAGGSPLVGVEASDGTYLRHGTIEVVCDRLRFRASDEEVEATAGAGNRVTVLDTAGGRHFTASEIVVDLRTGEWRAKRAQGTRVAE